MSEEPKARVCWRGPKEPGKTHREDADPLTSGEFTK